MKNKNNKLYNRYIKRIIDIILSLFVLMIAVVPMIIIAILVKFKLGSPIIFKQARPGKDEKVFNMYKFRTMTDQKDSKGNLLPDKDRLTSFGLALRKTSLDELPEIFNILKGEMSWVGPRPLLVDYLPYYKTKERLRHSVRPGLTGWSQVNGRNNTTWEKMFENDIYYVINQSFLFDLKIMLMTVEKVFKRSNISAPGSGKLNQEREIQNNNFN